MKNIILNNKKGTLINEKKLIMANFNYQLSKITINI